MRVETCARPQRANAQKKRCPLVCGHPCKTAHGIEPARRPGTESLGVQQPAPTQTRLLWRTLTCSNLSPEDRPEQQQNKRTQVRTLQKHNAIIYCARCKKYWQWIVEEWRHIVRVWEGKNNSIGATGAWLNEQKAKNYHIPHMKKAYWIISRLWLLFSACGLVYNNKRVEKVCTGKEFIIVSCEARNKTELASPCTSSEQAKNNNLLLAMGARMNCSEFAVGLYKGCMFTLEGCGSTTDNNRRKVD